MNRTITLAMAGVCIATAGPVDAARETYGGLSCGLSAARPLDSTIAYGVLTGGPWHEGPPRPEVEITLTCRVEAETGGDRVVVTEQSVTSAGVPATLPPSPVSFDMGGSPHTNLWVCTEVSVYDPGAMPPHKVRQVDADGDPTNGAQCQKTEPASGDLVYIYVAPPHPSNKGDQCMYVGHGQQEIDLPPPLRPIPPPPEEYCVPWS